MSDDVLAYEMDRVAILVGEHPKSPFENRILAARVRDSAPGPNTHPLAA